MHQPRSPAVRALAGVTVLVLGIGALALGAEAGSSGDPEGDGPAAVAASAAPLGPAAGEARPRPSRWWSVPWSQAATVGTGEAAEADPEVEAPPGLLTGTAADDLSAAPFADEDDLVVDRSDIVARRTSEGFDVAAGGATFGTGPQVTYTVELEPAVGEDLLAVTAAVEQALGDPRSWARERRFVRVDDPARASVRILLATPATVDRLCAQVGLRTVGRYSCWTGRFTALNSWRWAEGADAFGDLTTYRRYLVNHEVGHALGYGHVGCPEQGALAPVMMQQSMGTDGCVANGWPYP